MAKFDVIQLEFPDLSPAVEDWLWLDRKILTSQARIVETERIIDFLLRQFGSDPDSMCEAQKLNIFFKRLVSFTDLTSGLNLELADFAIIVMKSAIAFC